MKARRVRNKLERVRIKINESEINFVRFEMKLLNTLIAEPLESLFRNLRLRHGKYQKLYNFLKKIFRLKN